MTGPICRCGREKWQHEPLPVNSFMPPCRNYDPMDFRPFEKEIAGEDGMGCHCDLHNELAYEVSKPQSNWVPLANTLYDALLAGTHSYRSWEEWAEKLRANQPEGRAFQTSGSFMASGMGVGVTPRGINGAMRREREATS